MSELENQKCGFFIRVIVTLIINWKYKITCNIKTEFILENVKNTLCMSAFNKYLFNSHKHMNIPTSIINLSYVVQLLYLEIWVCSLSRWNQDLHYLKIFYWLIDWFIYLFIYWIKIGEPIGMGKIERKQDETQPHQYSTVCEPFPL